MAPNFYEIIFPKTAPKSIIFLMYEQREAKEEATQEKRLIFLQNQLDYYQRELYCLKKKLDHIAHRVI